MVLVQRQVLHAKLCPGVCLMERFGWFLFFIVHHCPPICVNPPFEYIFSAGLSLGHNRIWQSHNCHYPDNQNHPRVHREKVQKVQQRSHKVGFDEVLNPKTWLSIFNRCLLKCCQCCLWCLEKFMRFINRNAYIMCAVKVSSILYILFYLLSY